MTRFWREGHLRYSRNGTLHEVGGHWVDRDAPVGIGGTTSWFTPRPSGVAAASAAWLDPNASCPVCGAEVYFYQNRFGSRVFFDEVGPPWPKHPCTDTVSRSSLAPLDVTTGVMRSLGAPRELDASDAQNSRLRVLVVVGIEKVGRKRHLTLEDVDGENFVVATSPPAPPLDAIAVEIGAELHWMDPDSGSRGRSPVWGRLPSIATDPT